MQPRNPLVPTLRVGTQAETLRVDCSDTAVEPIGHTATQSVRTCVPTRSVGTRWMLPIFALTFIVAGCNRQDTECISRIGRKVSAHAKASSGEMGAKIDLSWAGMKREPGLQEKVQDRLRFENTLADVALDVHVKEKQVELKGTVKTPSQRQRAIELADTVAGVERVIDSIVVREAEDAAK